MSSAAIEVLTGWRPKRGFVAVAASAAGGVSSQPPHRRATFPRPHLFHGRRRRQVDRNGSRRLDPWLALSRHGHVPGRVGGLRHRLLAA